MPASNHFVSAAGLVINSKGQFLLVKSPLRGWEFPGGMVESGESLPQALQREIREESGAEVSITELAGLSKNLIRNIVNVDFFCAYAGGALTTSEESTEVGWFTRAQAVEMIRHPLYAIRFRKMLRREGVYCFSFKPEPFRIIDDGLFPTMSKH